MYGVKINLSVCHFIDQLISKDSVEGFVSAPGMFHYNVNEQQVIPVGDMREVVYLGCSASLCLPAEGEMPLPEND